MTDFVIYETANGRVFSSGSTNVPIGDIAVDSGYGVVEGIAVVSTDYVLAGTITARPTITPAIDAETIQTDGGYNANITGIPTGWTYLLPNGETGTTNGTTVSFRAIEPGTYTVLFSKWPYIPYEVTINAVSTVL